MPGGKTPSIQMNKLLLFIKPLFVLVVIISCGRTPSEERFEQSTGIPIPNNVEVLKDEYQDMLQDYAINYSIRLTPSQLQDMTSSIRGSEFYNSRIIGSDLIKDDYLLKESDKSVWYRTNSGYLFANRNNRTSITANLDTTTLIMEFSESLD